MRTTAIILLYAFAFAFIWLGTQTAPQVGWPRNDLELNGCAALILGMIAKTAGHWLLLGLDRRPQYA